MRSPEIVVGDPVGDLGAGVVKIEEQGLVEQLVAHPTIDEATIRDLHQGQRP